MEGETSIPCLFPVRELPILDSRKLLSPAGSQLNKWDCFSLVSIRANLEPLRLASLPLCTCLSRFVAAEGSEFDATFERMNPKHPFRST